MKIYLSKINESWIIDRIREEWYENNSHISTRRIRNADIIWVTAPWTWRKISQKQLRLKKVLCSYYHFDFDKFGNDDEKNFYELDSYVDEYHVISKKTKLQLETLTDKKITSIPFWVNQNIWFEQEINEKEKTRSNYGFSSTDYLVGSFQRDTEGFDLKSPKLSKGPDIFLEIVSDLYKKNKNLVVVLTGKRRNYLINNLNERQIPYKYFEMVNFNKLNKLYNILDLYIVSSRVEGGPQSILEAGITKTPIISTNVGVAPEILDKKSIYINDYKLAIPQVEIAYKNAKSFILPDGMNKFLSIFDNMVQNN